jgi:hypothetical protein
MGLIGFAIGAFAFAGLVFLTSVYVSSFVTKK